MPNGARPAQSRGFTLLVCQRQGGDQMPGKANRTTHRSSSGTKLYAVRDAKGRFKDIQTYKRAQGSDIKRRSKDEK
jgi:hypothetical protein